MRSCRLQGPGGLFEVEMSVLGVSEGIPWVLPVGSGQEAGAAEGGTVSDATSTKTSAHPGVGLALIGGWAVTPHVKSLVTRP